MDFKLESVRKGAPKRVCDLAIPNSPQYSPQFLTDP